MDNTFERGQAISVITDTGVITCKVKSETTGHYYVNNIFCETQFSAKKEDCFGNSLEAMKELNRRRNGQGSLY